MQKRLLLCLLENNVLPQLGAVLFELNLALDKFLVLASPIGFAGRLVLDLDEFIL